MISFDAPTILSRLAELASKDKARRSSAQTRTNINSIQLAQPATIFLI